MEMTAVENPCGRQVYHKPWKTAVGDAVFHITTSSTTKGREFFLYLLKMNMFFFVWILLRLPTQFPQIYFTLTSGGVFESGGYARGSAAGGSDNKQTDKPCRRRFAQMVILTICTSSMCRSDSPCG